MFSAERVEKRLARRGKGALWPRPRLEHWLFNLFNKVVLIGLKGQTSIGYSLRPMIYKKKKKRKKKPYLIELTIKKECFSLKFSFNDPPSSI